MKRGYINLICLNIFSIIILLISNYILDKINYNILTIFMIGLMIMSFFLIGFEKERTEYLYNIRFSVITITIFYLLITYTLGIFTEFTQNIYNISFINIIKNVSYVLPLIILTELYRYQLICKESNYKICIVLSFIFFFLLELLPYIKVYEFIGVNSIITFTCTIILPLISKEIMLIYIAYKGGYTTTILYRILMEMNVYLIPISPNFGVYINAVLGIMFPPILIMVVYKITSKKQQRIKSYKKKYHSIFYITSLIFIIVFVLLVSGITKYQLFAIGSNSMNPLIKKGDVIIIKKIDDKKNYININDIIAFKKNNLIIVHRVIEIGEDGLYFYTKGDNNNTSDGYPVSSSDVVGIFLFHIPFIGLPTVWLNEVLLE